MSYLRQTGFPTRLLLVLAIAGAAALPSPAHAWWAGGGWHSYGWRGPYAWRGPAFGARFAYPYYARGPRPGWIGYGWAAPGCCWRPYPAAGFPPPVPVPYASHPGPYRPRPVAYATHVKAGHSMASVTAPPATARPASPGGAYYPPGE